MNDMTQHRGPLLPYDCTDGFRPGQAFDIARHAHAELCAGLHLRGDYMTGAVPGGDACFRLPFALSRYFNATHDSVLVPMDILVPKRVRQKGIISAHLHMWQNYYGIGGKRAPLSLSLRDDGLLNIEDGNSTFAVAKGSGWPQILGQISLAPTMAPARPGVS